MHFLSFYNSSKFTDCQRVLFSDIFPLIVCVIPAGSKLALTTSKKGRFLEPEGERISHGLSQQREDPAVGAVRYSLKMIYTGCQNKVPLSTVYVYS